MPRNSAIITPDSPAGTTGQQTPVFIGIDWASQSHAVCLIDPDRPRSAPRQQELPQQSEAIAAWAAQLQQEFPGRSLCVVPEQSRGALMHALLNCGVFLIYPVNPKQLARYREALFPSGGKNDPGDAWLLASFLQHYREQLRPWRPDSQETRRIAYLVEFRRKLVEERKRLTLKLNDALKVSFPFVLEHFEKKLSSPLVTKLLQSGKSRVIKRRFACPKFLRQTFHEFADHSRKWSPWAKAWYEDRRARGMKHHAALRTLAFKWIRIIFRLWKNRETYSEVRYPQALTKAESPIIALLNNN